MKNFYEKYFHAQAGEKYYNPKKNFTSYFLSFKEGCRLELMHKPEIPETINDGIKEYKGIIHFAMSVDSKERVDGLTNELRAAGL